MKQIDPRTIDGFVEAMSSAVAVVSVTGANGKALGLATPTLAPYSIAPPSIVASLPPDFPPCARFGVSVLTDAHASLAEQLWESVSPLSDHATREEVPIVPGPLLTLVCQEALRARADSRLLVIGDVVDVMFGAGVPLVWWRGRVCAAGLLDEGPADRRVVR